MEVYLVTNLVDGKKYVGQTVRRATQRWIGHTYKARKGEGNKLHEAMRHYGIDNFRVEVLCECPNRDAMNKAEQFFIWLLGTQKRTLGYNLTAGGDSHALPPESIEKMRQSLRGKPGGKKGKKYGPLSVEHKEKLRIASTGFRHSLETRARMSEIAKVSGNHRQGTVHRPETLDKLRASWTPERKKHQGQITSALRWLNKAIALAIAVEGCTSRAEAIRAVSVSYIQEHAVQAEQGA